MLAQVVLLAEILEYFSIRGIEQSATEIHISLDEKMNITRIVSNWMMVLIKNHRP